MGCTGVTLFSIMAMSILAGCGAPPESPKAPQPAAAAPAKATLAFEVADPTLNAALTADLDAGIAQVEQFFGAPFPRRFTFRVLADRAQLDTHWAERFHEPAFHSECWMVGMGMGDEFSILSPSHWRDQACEHDPGDNRATIGLITHELTHTYHAQVNPILDADSAAGDAIGWFVEGLAVLASGQLQDHHLAPADEAIRNGKAPAKLADAWTGKYRYGVSGSLVAYIDTTWGRATLRQMLLARTPAELLAPLGIDEPTLLARWQAWVLAGSSAQVK